MSGGDPSGAEMWGRYLYRGHEVVVVQQWADPFGRRMVRFASAAPGEEDAAAGMTEEAFLAEAQPAAPSPASGG